MPPTRVVAFLLFVVSGFCGLVYQIVWLRLAFAAFGIVTPVLSILLSSFMAGLALGSWLGGRLGGALQARSAPAAAIAYGLVECGIAAGAVLVPWAFGTGERALLSLGESSSGGYLFGSAIAIALPILLFATLMGTTFPLMMAFLRARQPGDAGTFSFLYLGNVIGAMLGAALTAAVLVEALGFRATLLVAATGNVAIGLVAFLLPRLATGPAATAPWRRRRGLRHGTAGRHDDAAACGCWLLFATGFTSMAMEVAWTRAFTPVLYDDGLRVRRGADRLPGGDLDAARRSTAATWGPAARRRPRRCSALLFPAALLPLVLNDPRWHGEVWIVLASIVPISALLGYLTPQLVDDHGRGDPAGAGTAYAINVLGCIARPAARRLHAAAGARREVARCSREPSPIRRSCCWRAGGRRQAAWFGGVATGAAAHCSPSPVTSHAHPRGRRASARRAAKCAATTSPPSSSHTVDNPKLPEKDNKRMLVNGIGITTLTDLTKVMAHLPLAVRETAAGVDAGDLLRHGHDVPFADQLGRPHHRRRAGAERAPRRSVTTGPTPRR
jgi:spermidine synthase